jgi:hypothetical protein
MNHVIAKWRPFDGCDRLPGIFLECTDKGTVRHDLSRPWIHPKDGWMYATDGRIMVRMQGQGYVEILKEADHPKVRKVRNPADCFDLGVLGLHEFAELPLVSNPCVEPDPCPRNGVHCDCPACEGEYRIDEPTDGVPIGDKGHRMGLRYVYLLQYFGVRSVQVPPDRGYPFRFVLGPIEGIVMGINPER